MKRILTMAVTVLTFAGLASADPLVDLDFGTGSFDGTVDTSRSESGGEISFDMTTPMFASGDYASAPTNGIFYGGMASSVDGGGNSKGVYEGKDSSPDFVQIGVGFNGTSGTSMEFAAAGVWKKEDFLSGFDTSQADLESLSVNITSNTGLSGMVTRWMVQIGSEFYVSQESQENAGLFETNDFTSSNWAPIDLSAGMLATHGSFSELAMNDVQAVGFYIRYDGDAQTRFLPAFDSFSAAAVPEPTSIVLLGLGGLATVIRRRRTG